MKKKEIQDLKSKPKAELLNFVKEGRERLRVLRFDLAAGKVKDVTELRSMRKDLARALTFIKQADKQEK
ncbi:MAG: 50S ribosomal protein L29 [Patescibacteria group bacterium]|nr:50S ribosomal protein L29 [Patescibacteria group bacterium]MDE2015562.1 50S ribosomal protein L29 [Patescibacteria group bacterium]MDE2227242.1 50S ribosomal protein L29 [Patescibacteria group bacterium]